MRPVSHPGRTCSRGVPRRSVRSVDTRPPCPAGRRLYLVETAQKGALWFRLTASGIAGHASMPTPVNSVVELSEAIARIGRHRFPVRLTPVARTFLESLAGEPHRVTGPGRRRVRGRRESRLP
ncbi:MAG: peptidase dimerization domain-containing protein [Actinoallomurus sp.]